MNPPTIKLFTWGIGLLLAGPTCVFSQEPSASPPQVIEDIQSIEKVLQQKSVRIRGVIVCDGDNATIFSENSAKGYQLRHGNDLKIRDFTGYQTVFGIIRLSKGGNEIEFIQVEKILDPEAEDMEAFRGLIVQVLDLNRVIARAENDKDLLDNADAVKITLLAQASFYQVKYPALYKEAEELQLKMERDKPPSE